jgi:ribonucleoside-diphosphate reductase alpha chain
VSFEQTSNPEYSQFIALSRYAKWLSKEVRRENWDETVKRYLDFFLNRGQIKKAEYTRLFEAIYNLNNMPSMRCMMTAGPALDRDNVAGFNCSYLIMNRVRAFDELMYILLCGTGVGFSCERGEVKELPEVSEEFHETDSVIVVSDSKIGWASAFRELIALLYAGKVPSWDLSKVRPAGAPLKTFGGRASGPEPLNELFNYAVALFKSSRGRRLSSLEVHGLVPQ